MCAGASETTSNRFTLKSSLHSGCWDTILKYLFICRWPNLKQGEILKKDNTVNHG